MCEVASSSPVKLLLARGPPTVNKALLVFFGLLKLSYAPELNLLSRVANWGAVLTQQRVV